MASQPPSIPPPSRRARPDGSGARPVPPSGVPAGQTPEEVRRESVTRRGDAGQAPPEGVTGDPGRHSDRGRGHGERPPAAVPPSYPPQDPGGAPHATPVRPAGRPGTMPPAYPPAQRGPAPTTSPRQGTPSPRPTRGAPDAGGPRRATPQGHPVARPTSRPQSRPTSRPALRPAAGPDPSRPAVPRGRRRGRGRRRWPLVLAVLLVLALAWPAFLLWDANRNLTRIDALSGAAGTPGTTYLIAGSDSRADGSVPDDTEGQRADSVMLVHVAPNGQTSAISLPRDTYVDIPGFGWDKLNASYSYGGAPTLVRTVESLTGLTVDHYVEVGMGGVSRIVDAVGGVELCLDMDVDDPKSELVWTAGCHLSDGRTALAFSRMRYSDPRGDIGRAERQRQVVSRTVSTAMSPRVLVNPVSALRLERAGAGALTVDRDTGGIDIARLVLAFRKAGNDSMTGAPPIESMGYETDSGSAVLLQDETAPEFFRKLREGTLTPADLDVMP